MPARQSVSTDIPRSAGVLETYGQGRFAHVPQPLSEDELERFRRDCKVTGFWVGYTDSNTLDGLRRLLATIDHLQASLDDLAYGDERRP